MDSQSPRSAPETAIERLERLRVESQGQRIVSMPLLKGVGHLVLDPLLIQEVFTSTLFIRPPFFRKAFGEGLLLAEGDRWSLSRRTVQPGLSPACVRSFAPMVYRFIEDLRDEWSNASDAGREVEVVADLAASVLRCAVNALLGADLGPHDARARSVVRLTAASNKLAGLGVFDPKALIDVEMVATLQKERAELESLAHELIEKRQNEPTEAEQSQDILSRLLEPSFLEAPVGDGGCPVGEKGLLDEIVLLLLASVETTTASTANAIELLSQHPEILQRMRTEIHAADPQVEDLPRHLPFTLACLRESLRIRPPVWFNGRYALERVELSSGDVVEEGDHVYMCPYLVHHDPDLWEEPDSYRPERFIDNEVREGASYMPFGLGRHYCVGAGLATLIGTTVLARIIGDFDVVISKRPTHEPDSGFLLGPALDSRAHVTRCSGNPRRT